MRSWSCSASAAGDRAGLLAPGRAGGAVDAGEHAERQHGEDGRGDDRLDQAEAGLVARSRDPRPANGGRRVRPSHGSSPSSSTVAAPRLRAFGARLDAAASGPAQRAGRRRGRRASRSASASAPSRTARASRANGATSTSRRPPRRSCDQTPTIRPSSEQHGREPALRAVDAVAVARRAGRRPRRAARRRRTGRRPGSSRTTPAGAARGGLGDVGRRASSPRVALDLDLLPHRARSQRPASAGRGHAEPALELLARRRAVGGEVAPRDARPTPPRDRRAGQVAEPRARGA